jgi:hypothetical protein
MRIAEANREMIESEAQVMLLQRSSVSAGILQIKWSLSKDGKNQLQLKNQ